MQNARGHHVVPPYVLRTVPGASISMPLSWKQLTAKLKTSQFNLRNIFTKLEKGGRKDPITGSSSHKGSTGNRREAPRVIAQAELRSPQSQSSFYKNFYKPMRDEIVARWSAQAAPKVANIVSLAD